MKKSTIKKVAVSTTLTAGLLLTSIPFNVLNTPTVQTQTVEAAQITFSDVSPNMTAYNSIMSLAEKGIIKGFEDGTFRPAQEVTRGQVAAFIVRALNLQGTESNFKDVPKTMALYPEISAAYQAGIIQGFANGEFKPNQPVKRQEIAAMIDRAMQKQGAYNNSAQLAFGDANTISSYAYDSVARMTAYGIIQGTGNNTFKPLATADRQQTAMFINRMLNVLAGKDALDGDKKPTPTPTPTPTPPPTQVTPGNVDEGDKYTSTYTLEGMPGLYEEPKVTYNNPIDLKPGELYKATMNKDWPNGITNSTIWTNWTTKEIEAIIGEFRYIVRVNGEIFEVNEVKDILSLQNPDYPQAMTFLVNYFGNFRPMIKHNIVEYPQTEIISINGVPYRNTVYAPDWANGEWHDDRVSNVMVVKAPAEEGQFKLDFHTYTADQVTYLKDRAYPLYLTSKPTAVANGEDFMVDIKTIFSETQGLVTVSNDGYTLSYGDVTVKLTKDSDKAVVNGQTVTLSAPVKVTNGVLTAPIKAVADALGLDTRVQIKSTNTLNDGFDRIEITNYKQELREGIWKD